MAVSTYNFKINGLINPDNNILDNLNLIATSSACWITFDAINGLWSVIVNEEETPVASFNDHNIIGGISISGTGIAQLYNAVSVDFPHKDLSSQTDYIDLSLDSSYWYPHEETNTMSLSFSMINDPIQAQYIGSSELKQSRCDKIVQFTTDYSMIGLKAGEVISITTDMYGFVNKPFRITKLEEDDADDGTIQIRITAIEYDADVYSDSGFVAKTRTKKTGIIPKSLNTVVNQSDSDKIGEQNSNSTTAKNNLYQLDDVNLTAPVSNGQVLAYDGVSWVNANATKSSLVDGQIFNALAVIADNTFHSYSLGYSDFTIPVTGAYLIEMRMGFNTTFYNNTYLPPLGVDKFINLYARVNGVDQLVWVGEYDFCSVNSPIVITHPVTITAGDTINWRFEYKTNYYTGYTAPPGYPSYTVDPLDNQLTSGTILLWYTNKTTWS